MSDLVTHLLRLHIRNVELIECQHCEYKAIDKNQFQNHIETYHWELSFMAHIASNLDAVSQNFEKFKGELTNILNVIIDDHNVIKQEMFINRQENHKHMEKKEKIEEVIINLANKLATASSSSTTRESSSSHPDSSSGTLSVPRPT